MMATSQNVANVLIFSSLYSPEVDNVIFNFPIMMFLFGITCQHLIDFVGLWIFIRGQCYCSNICYFFQNYIAGPLKKIVTQKQCLHVYIKFTPFENNDTRKWILK